MTQAELNRVKIPLPPLPVQSEIVRVLDNFAELTSELTARKKQYEYYRDLLLTFSNADATIVDKTRQDKTRQDKTRQDKDS